MTSIIQQFKAFLYQVGYGESTQNMLPACVSEFMDHQQIKDINCIEQEKVKKFYWHLHERPLKKRSGALSEMMISHYVYALKTFFSWLEITGQIDYNPISGMKFKRAKQHVREPLTTDEIKLLFEAAGSLKERALLHVFYSCGLRRSEGEALNIQDIHFKGQLLFVREGKCAKRRVVPVTERVSKSLEDYYLHERCNSTVKNVKDMQAFILNKRGYRMKGDGYNKMLKELLEKTRNAELITHHCTLHHLRHSIATHLLQSGMSMEYVRDFLGHTFLETTQLYAKPHAGQLKLL